MEELALERRSRTRRHKKVYVEYYGLRRRNVLKLPCNENDVFINNRTNLQVQIHKCEKLFRDGFTEIVIHGLGAAVTTAVNVALMLQERLSHTVDISVNTSTVNLIDDFIPLNDNERPFTESRSSSAVHISVKRKTNF